MFGGFNLEQSFLHVENRTAMLEYVELAVHVMVGYGIGECSYIVFHRSLTSLTLSSVTLCCDVGRWVRPGH
jgi:hypothetical protein